MACVEVDDDDNVLTPTFLRDRGRGRARRAMDLLARADDAWVLAARGAIADLVDAFLHDRGSNADLFAVVHELGRLLSERAKCRWTQRNEAYELLCPIHALHRPFAHSPALTQLTTCSVCGAGEFACRHVAGRVYDGEMCERVVASLGPLGHVAFTVDPDFLYTWHQPSSVPTAELVAEGIISSAGDPAVCTHCRDCEGQPTPDELSPGARFARLRVEAARRAFEEPDAPTTTVTLRLLQAGRFVDM